MGDYGFKVSKPGYDVKTATPQQLVFSSKYPTLRIQTRGSGVVTHTGGRIAVIPHNLGYVPMFDVHVADYGSAYYQLLPYVDEYNKSIVMAYADATNLYVKVDDNYGYVQHLSNDSGEETSMFGYLRGAITVGNNHPSYGNCDGAIRFTLNVAKNAPLYDARLHFYVTERQGSSNMYFKVWGIAEDNTGDFGSDPLGRPTTTHSHRPEGNPGAGSFFTFGIKDAMNDVITRSGWASGNNFGIIMRREPELPANNSIRDAISGPVVYVNSYLTTLTQDNLISYKYTIYKDKIE